MFDVKLDKQPLSFLSSCETILEQRIRSKLELLATNPVPQGTKRIVGAEFPTFRIRIGKYRVLYRINFQSRTVVIVKFDHRDRVY